MTSIYRARLIEHDIRMEYADLAQRTGETAVRLSAIRPLILDSTRAEVDRVLDEMARRDGIHLRGEADQKTLTAADRQGAIRLGGTDRHTISIEPGH